MVTWGEVIVLHDTLKFSVEDDSKLLMLQFLPKTILFMICNYSLGHLSSVGLTPKAI